MPDYPTTPKQRAALPTRRLLAQLPGEPCFTLYCRAKHQLDFGRHWVWRHGGEQLTAEGLRALADLFDQEREAAAAVVCRRLATELASEGREAPGPTVGRPAEVDTYAMLERRGLA